MQILSSYPKATPVVEKEANNIESAKEVERQNVEAKQNAKTEPKQEFSTRAEKFSQLNKEFDITASNFKITDTFINRLKDLEILTSDQAEKLSIDLKPEIKETESLSLLDTKINELKKRIKNEPGVDSLITILDKSQKILSNLNGSKDSSFPIDPSTAAAGLDQFLKSEGSSILTKEEKQTVGDLRIALLIADKLNPEQRTSAEVSKYMEILNQNRYT
jgi:hypothetical protein